MNYCNVHQVSMEQGYSKTKLDNNGQPKPYFFHKVNDQMCFGKGIKDRNSSYQGTKPAFENTSKTVSKGNADSMYACNAMNNAVSLATAGKIELEQIGLYYKKIYKELTLTEKPEDLDGWKG